MIDLSVVVPARDAESELPHQLDALLTQDWAGAWEIVVVDNGSTDATAEIVRHVAADDSRVRLVEAKDGSGAGFARNVGARAASGRWLAFCDSDDVAAPGWVAAMAACLETHPFVAGPFELDRLNPPWLAASRGRAFASDINRFAGLVPFASSGNVGIHREPFEAVGGFDERLAAGEDIELSLRLWRMGVELHFCANALVHCRYRRETGARWRQARRFGASHAELLERARHAGIATPSRVAGARNWVWLIRRLPSVRTRQGRARWLWVAGTRLGEVSSGLRSARPRL
jgi:glycosyltransferase involved in cell wall biosynthesis